ncbi:sodium:solute symporter family protein [Oleiharenicola lentus]|uniref:sodium:solute symporter family protein n=1 Tax=Oleiharenicola lentus TaxID=2508720 RepID=UPI003F67D15E
MLGSLHPLDLVVVALYLIAVIWIGSRAAAGTNNEEGFFLAGRKLGKLYQFFLNFGNATEPQGAVSTASFVYQQGAPGSWLSFQTVFMNPYFWFMNVWFRRVRLTTVSDLFEDRYASKGLSLFYAVFQILVACVFLGFGNVTAYKIASSLVVKQEVQWTAAERTSVEGYREMKALEKQAAAGTLTAEMKPALDTLRDRNARGELRSYVTVLNDIAFYAVFTLVVGAYIVLGGMAAAAVNEGLQSVLIIVFSLLLIPTGLKAIGGWSALAEKVPKQMFDLFGSASAEQFSVVSLCGILLVSIVQNGGLSHNMGICGSAKDEFAARSGVSGTYLKRFMIILWAFAGLIAVALFGVGGLSDPDATWGAMSNRLLGPGLVGLMLAGVLAGTMSTLAAKALAISSLFVRNVYRQIWPDITQAQGVFYARCTIVAVLILGTVAATLMGSFYDIVNIVLTVNIPFGAAVLMTYWWRRVTAPAVWCCVIISTLTILVVPWTASKIPALAQSASLAQPSTKPGTGVYFSKVVHQDPNDLTSPYVAAQTRTNRFNFEVWLLGKAGVNVAALTPTQRFTLQFFVDGLLPFAVLIIASLLTKKTDPARVAQFYGKMKTPVGKTPELEIATMEETARNPARFDDTKLFGRNSSWEFCKWDRVDTIGFIICCAISASIVGIFIGFLRWAAP